MVIKAESIPTVPQNCSGQVCSEGTSAIRDALYVIGGKWKLPLIFALSGGPSRFNDIQRALEGITAKTLSRELKEMELNGFVVRKEQTRTPASITYELTAYSRSLHRVTHELKAWGLQHRGHIGASKKQAQQPSNGDANIDRHQACRSK